MGFETNLFEAAKANPFFRQELFTLPQSQVVLMSLEPGEDIGLEAHSGLVQTLVFLDGTGQGLIGEHTFALEPGSVAVVPAGVQHNFTNTGDTPMKLFTVYAPPEHAPGTVHRTRAEAMAAEAEEHAHEASALTVGSLMGQAL